MNETHKDRYARKLEEAKATLKTEVLLEVVDEIYSLYQDTLALTNDYDKAKKLHEMEHKLWRLLPRRLLWKPRRWQKQQKYILNKFPKCQKPGCENNSEVVHHKDKYYKDLGKDVMGKNLEALCNECHDKRHPEHSTKKLDNRIIGFKTYGF